MKTAIIVTIVIVLLSIFALVIIKSTVEVIRWLPYYQDEITGEKFKIKMTSSQLPCAVDKDGRVRYVFLHQVGLDKYLWMPIGDRLTYYKDIMHE